MRRMISMRLEEDMIDQLDALGERLGWNRTQVIEHCVLFGLKEGEQFADRMRNPLWRAALRVVTRMEAKADPAARGRIEKMLDKIAGELDAAAEKEAMA